MENNGMGKNGYDYLNEYVGYLRARNYSGYTIKSYRKYIVKYLDECYNNEEYKLGEEHPLDIQNYIDKFKDKPATANLTLNALRGFYRYLANVVCVIHNDPCVALKGVKQEINEKEYLTAEQIKEVIDAVDGLHMNRNKLIIILMAIDCLRISEVMNIEMDDIDLENNTIYIKGKGKRNRTAYITDKMREYLDDYLEDRKAAHVSSTSLFTSCDGKSQIPRTTIECFLHKLEKKTNMKLNPHKFRHSGATLAYESSHDIVAVQNLLGHENIETTKRYTHVSEENRRNLVQNSPVNNIL